MKIKIFKLLPFFLLVFSITGCDTGNSSGSDGEDTYNNAPIICFGDSLTEGYGASKPFAIDRDQSYPAFLQKSVRVSVINAGVSGDTTADGLSRIKKDVLEKNPQLVIILLGGNNFLDLEAAINVKKDLQAMINMLRNKERKIYLASFIGDSTWEAFYFDLFSEELESDLTVLLDDYKKIFSELIIENGDIGYIGNIWKNIGREKMSDLIHPNAEGYKIMADNIFNEIKPHLKENNLLK